LIPVFIFSASAQRKEQATKMYQKLGYKEAIKLYESKDELSLEDMERIANAYRLNHDTENAALWFEQVIDQSKEAINFLYFAQALQSNGDYQKAKKYYLLYSELLGNQSNDQRGNYLAAAIDRMNDWNNEEDVILKPEMSINSSKLDFSPAFYNDGIVFVSSRKLKDSKKYKWTGDHFMNLFYAPANKEGVLDSVQSFSKMINSKFHEGPVTFDKSYSRIFFTRNDHRNGKPKKNKKGVMKLGIFTALQDGEKWTAPKPVAFNTKEYEECHPSLSADGKYLYFASDRAGGEGGMDIYVSEFKAGEWSEPENLGPEINTPGNDVFPFMHDSGTLYFASDGWGGMGGLDIFFSKKDGEVEWTTAMNLGHPYNSRKDDFGFVLNLLGTEGYLTSSRAGGRGKDDIYSFKRSPKAMEQPKLRLAAFDVETNEKIPSTTFYLFRKKEYMQANVNDDISIEMLDTKTENLDKTKAKILLTKEDGTLEIPVNEEKKYIFIIEKEGYHSVEKTIEIPKKNNVSLHFLNVPLEKKKCIALNGTVLNIDNEKGIEKAKVTLVNLCTGEEVTSVSHEDGRFEFICVDYDCDYILKGDKENYESGSTTFSTINLSEERSEKSTKDIYLVWSNDLLKPNKSLEPVSESIDKKQVARTNVLEKRKTSIIRSQLDSPSEKYKKELSAASPSKKVNEHRSPYFDAAPESISKRHVDIPEGIYTYTNYDARTNARSYPTRPIEELENPTVEEPVIVGDVFELRDLYYPFDEYTVNESAAKELDHLVQVMSERSSLEIELSSHTDARGRTNYNQWLSRKRAMFAVKYIIDQGVDPSRIVARGYGEHLLRNHCDDETFCEEEDHQKNRRTEIKVIKN